MTQMTSGRDKISEGEELDVLVTKINDTRVTTPKMFLRRSYLKS